MNLIKSREKNKYARYLIIGTLFFLLMANWNFHKLNVMFDKWNSVIMAAVLTIALALVCDFKDIIKDKLLWLVLLVNMVAVANILVLGSGVYVIVPLYCLTLGLYIAPKLKFDKKEVLLTAILMAFFFFYWTFDVKGYFKGYTINYGGLVLISGFIFVVFLIEYLRYQILTGGMSGKIWEFIKVYPYLITAVEIFMFLWAYNIISWYRSRTAFFALIVLAVMMLIPRKVMGNRLVFPIIIASTILGGFLIPVAYVYIGSRVNIVDYQMFYKPLFSSRLPVWKDLFSIYRNYILTGVGTIYTSNEIYRPGLLDTMDAYIDLLVVYGPVVCAGVLALICGTLLKLRKSVEKSQFGKLAFIGIIVMLAASYAESMIITEPFTLIFVITVSVAGNVCSEECFGESSDYIAVDFTEYKRRVNGTWGTKVLASFLAVFLPVFLVLVLGPVEVYYANYDEFSFTNWDYFWIFIALAFIIIFIVTSVISVLPDQINKIVVAVLTAISTASYVQYMFLNKRLIMEDGEFVDAASLGNYPIITLGIYTGTFLLICIIIFIFRKNTYHVASGISGFITAITLIAVLSLFLTHIGSRKEKLWYSGEDEFKVGKGENVIVIVPDTFGREALNAMLEVYPDAVDFLNDFTFYENEDSQYFPTFPALHHMLSGYPYDESMTRYEYTKAAFESEGAKEFFGELHERDYTVRLFTRDMLFEQVTEGLVDNIEEAHITIDRKSLFKYLYKVSMYRYVPYVLKAKYQVDTMDIENINQYNGVGSYFLNSDFYKGMQEQGVSVDDTINNAFILHHIRGAHMPYMSNADSELVPDNSVSGEETSYGTMKLIKEYLDRLKDIDKYDDSTIIIVADHGFYETDSIFYVKKKGEEHSEMNVCDELLKHEDFQDFVRGCIR